MKSGDQIDNYTLLHKCGRGAFGTVFLAQDDKGKCVALKAVSLMGDGGDRELQALKSYKKCGGHACLLKIHKVVMKETFFYYTMEPADSIQVNDNDGYVPCTLEEVLNRSGKLNVVQTTELLSQLLEALEIIHEQGLVHRDIKPSNIFWVNKRAKLGDIGLLANDCSLTLKAGSPYFIPPSTSCIPKNSTAVDLYAITRIIFCCLSGKQADMYPELEPTDDIFKNGQRLLKIMNMSDEKIAKSTVKDFQKILGSTMITKKTVPHKKPTTTRRPNRTTSNAEETSLSTIPMLSILGSAKSWICKNKVGKTVAIAAGAKAGAVAAGIGATAVAGAVPVVLPALAIYALYKKFSKKK